MEIISQLVEVHIFRRKDDDIEFLLLKRNKNENYPGIWQMVTGSINENEKAFECALREVEEETGLQPEKFWVIPNVNSFYSPEKDATVIIPVFAALVKSDAIVKLSNEHSEFLWLKKDEAKKLLAWNGQRISVDTIHQYITSETSKLYFNEIIINQKK